MQKCENVGTAMIHCQSSGQTIWLFLENIFRILGMLDREVYLLYCGQRSNSSLFKSYFSRFEKTILMCDFKSRIILTL